MLSKTFQVTFFLRREKARESSSIPIYARITINRQSTVLSTKLQVAEENWDIATGRVLPSNKKNKDTNTRLNLIAAQINQAYTTLIRDGRQVSVHSLKQELLGGSDNQKTLLLVTEDHNNEFKTLIGKKYSYGSYKNYKTTYKYLREFISLKFHRTDILLSEIDYAFGKAYYMFLVKQKQCSNNGAVKHLQRLKKLVNYAITLGYLERNPLSRLKLELDEFRREVLSIEELHLLQNLTLPKTLEVVRDCFIFQCYTGLSYSDIKKLKMSELHNGVNGRPWLIIYRQKTNTRSPVPLLPEALAILNRYLPDSTDDNLIFPVLSNQKMNVNLKKIAVLASIKINLSTHVGRHTFATTITLANDVPIETVSKMLGHTNLRTTQVYAKVIDTKVSNDMTRLMDKLKSPGAGV